MRLVCPACETAYDVPRGAVRPGRTLRCARCRHDWVPAQADPVPEALPAPHESAPVAQVPLPRTSQQNARPSAKPAARAEVMAAWFLTVLLLSAGIAESLYWRRSIIRAWPPSERAYALLGYHPSPDNSLK